jgi:glycosyltransferase involved in cell wall biosynthesis
VSSVTVAIPVRNGGALLAGVLDALAAQTVAHELIVCDSGSSDGSVALAREHGARVIEIEPSAFGHGRTRNVLLEHSSGEHVALLSQDAQPASERWLERMLAGFALGEDVALVYGPYLPRPGAPEPVRLELERFFAPHGEPASPSVERLSARERSQPAIALMGRRGFFTDANACLRRSAWSAVRYRDVAMAEDRVLAVDMLRAGYAKAYVPEASVLHSHEYSPRDQLRRSFDEWRGLLEVYGWREPASPRRALAQLRGELGYARRRLGGEDSSRLTLVLALAGVAEHHLARQAGAMLGSRADRIPPALRRVLSLEHRSSYAPVRLDAPMNAQPAQELPA